MWGVRIPVCLLLYLEAGVYDKEPSSHCSRSWHPWQAMDVFHSSCGECARLVLKKAKQSQEGTAFTSVVMGAGLASESTMWHGTTDSLGMVWIQMLGTFSLVLMSRTEVKQLSWISELHQVWMSLLWADGGFDDRHNCRSQVTCTLWFIPHPLPFRFFLICNFNYVGSWDTVSWFNTFSDV